MKIKTAASLIAAAFALLAQGAYAADAASAPKSRADVKAETQQAAKKGDLAPAGEGKMPITPASKKSDTTRAAVKGDTASAEKAGKLAPAGEGKTAITPASKTSDTTRPAVKDATKDAAKKGELTPAGEGPTAPKK